MIESYQNEIEKYGRLDAGSMKNNLLYYGLKLAEESGEFAGCVTRIFRDNSGIITAEGKKSMMLELGDILWCITRAAEEMGLTLDDIAESNIRKLDSRLERGCINGKGNYR